MARDNSEADSALSETGTRSINLINILRHEPHQYANIRTNPEWAGNDSAIRQWIFRAKQILVATGESIIQIEDASGRFCEPLARIYPEFTGWLVETLSGKVCLVSADDTTKQLCERLLLQNNQYQQVWHSDPNPLRRAAMQLILASLITDSQDRYHFAVSGRPRTLLIIDYLQALGMGPTRVKRVYEDVLGREQVQGGYLRQYRHILKVMLGNFPDSQIEPVYEFMRMKSSNAES